MRTKIKDKPKQNQLLSSELDLVDEAKKALLLAYAPYSKFKVGVAVRLVNGAIYLGANIENASYPLCLCGERVALAHAHAAAPGIAVKAIAIISQSQKKKSKIPVSPCGACRQVISEWEGKQKKPIQIILSNQAGSLIQTFHSIQELLPLSFDAAALK
jgi:cytidine deaminase